MTGATGFVGTNLVERLVSEGSQVFTYTRTGRPVFEACSVLHGDVEDFEATRRAVEAAEPEVIFHLASTSFNRGPKDGTAHFKVITIGTRNLLLATPPGVRIVHTGSGAEYGCGTAFTEDSALQPTTELGVAKVAATLLVQAYARIRCQQAVTLRLFTPYGPWEHPERLIPHAILAAARGEDVTIGSGRQRRDFVYIDDVVDALLLAASEPVPPGSIFNVCSGQSTSVYELVKTVVGLMGDRVGIAVGALPTRPDEIWECSGSNQAARQTLGWQPRVVLSDGLARSITWFTSRD